MRRRNKFRGRVPAELVDYRVWCQVHDLAGFEDGAFVGWCEARADWSQTNGWPTGGNAREAEEVAAARLVPEEPWDGVVGV